MEPLICPQCGGQITEYKPGATFATCEYCSTKFLISENKQERPVYTTPEPAEPVQTAFAPPLGAIFAALMVAMVLIVFIAAIRIKKDPVSSTTSSRTTPSPKSSPTASPDLALLRFGTTGADNGQFNGADSIAVDSDGRIYVSDDKLR